MSDHKLYTRGGLGPYAIRDTADTAKHGFWESWANETWEAKSLAVFESFVAELDNPQAVVFDVGAWVGPYTLVAAAYGVNVLAIEPDPIAYEGLLANLALNRMISRYVASKCCAVAAEDGHPVEMHRRGEWGDSMSSMTREMTVSDDPVLLVPGRSLAGLMADFGTPSLIKMDIEGGEAVVMPTAGPLLRERKIPVLLSTHANWYGSAEAARDLELELDLWKLEFVEGEQLSPVPSRNSATWFARPK